MEENKNQEGTVEQDLSKLYRWVCGRLRTGSGKVTREDFAEYHRTMKYPERRLAEAWADISKAVPLVLKSFAIDVERSSDKKTLECRSPVPGALPKNANFDPYEDEEEKSKIGKLVARFLKQRPADWVIALGSGTTCLHVARELHKLATETKRQYPQKNVFTTNVAIATEWAQWAEGQHFPFNQLHLPEAVLDLDQMRFSKTWPTRRSWTFSVAVLGAHRCLLGKDGKAQLRSAWGPTADDNQWFLDHVEYGVIVCLPSKRLAVTEEEEGYAGFTFGEQPSKTIKMFLVTDDIPKGRDNEPDTTKLYSLEEAGWTIVKHDDDWTKKPGWLRESLSAAKGTAR